MLGPLKLKCKKMVSFGALSILLLLPGVIEWMYTNKVPKVDKESCWSCLGLLQTLGLSLLENIIFQYVDQRVRQFNDHFPQDTWIWYLSQTAQNRPDFAPVILKTAFLDMGTTSPILQYELAKRIVLRQQQRGIPLNEFQISRLMDAVEFDRMDTDTLSYISSEDIVPQAQMAYYSRQAETSMAPLTEMDKKQGNLKQDSALEVLDRQLTMVDSPRMENKRASCESFQALSQTEDCGIRELRRQLESTIGQDPVLILSPATESEDELDLIPLAPRAHDRFLSTEDILQRVGKKLQDIATDKEFDSVNLSNPVLSQKAGHDIPVREPEMKQRQGPIPERRESLVFRKDPLSKTGAMPSLPIHIDSQIGSSALNPDPTPPPSLSSSYSQVQHPAQQQRKALFNMRSSRSRELNHGQLGQASSFSTKPGLFRPRQGSGQPPSSMLPRPLIGTQPGVVTGYAPPMRSEDVGSNYEIPQNRQRSYTSQPSPLDQAHDQAAFAYGQSPAEVPRGMPGSSSLQGSRYDLRASHSMYNLNFDALQNQGEGDLESLGYPVRKKPSGFFDMIKGFF